MGRILMSVVVATVVGIAVAGCSDGDVTYTCDDLPPCCANATGTDKMLCHQEWLNATMTHSSCDAFVREFKQKGAC